MNETNGEMESLTGYDKPSGEKKPNWLRNENVLYHEIHGNDLREHILKMILFKTLVNC